MTYLSYAPRDYIENRDKLPPYNKKNAVVVLFWATWCDFGTYVKLIWDEISKEKLQIKMIDIESTNFDIRKFDIWKFPCIRLYVEGIDNPDNYIEYSSIIESDAIMFPNEINSQDTNTRNKTKESIVHFMQTYDKYI